MDAEGDAVTPRAPEARLAPNRRPSWIWFPPLLALALVLVAAISSWKERGVPIELHFQHGYGLKPGDTLRYRGINVGEIERVALDAELSAITVHVRLDSASEEIARAGSRFWVVRPQIGLTGIVGIDTVIGARYVAVQPGHADAPPQRSFVGMDTPPVLENVEPGTLEIVLEARRRGSLQAGAPLTYRGITIGGVLSVGLASDSTSIEVRTYVEPLYTTLVRDNTRFWDLGGLDAELGLSGAKLRVDSLEALLVGGIGMATPTRAGEPVESGRHFALAEGPEEEWLEWRPPIPLGASGTEAVGLPNLTPVLQTWRGGMLLASDRERSGWALPVEEGWILPTDFTTIPEGARDDSTALTIGGRAVVRPSDAIGLRGGLSLVPRPPAETSAWPARRIRTLSEVEECLIVTSPSSDPLALAGSRLSAEGGRWWVDLDRALRDRVHGAAVVARADGALVGLLLVEGDRARIAAIGGPP